MYHEHSPFLYGNLPPLPPPPGTKIFSYRRLNFVVHSFKLTEPSVWNFILGRSKSTINENTVNELKYNIDSILLVVLMASEFKIWKIVFKYYALHFGYHAKNRVDQRGLFILERCTER